MERSPRHHAGCTADIIAGMAEYTRSQKQLAIRYGIKPPVKKQEEK
jgi:hypothetical protein